MTERGATIWLTGLSGAGKSTITEMLAAQLRAQSKRVEVLDGDEIRRSLSAGLGFSREDRDTHVRRVGWVAKLLARNGVVVLVPVIAPYEQTRNEVRAEHEADGIAYREVYISTPLQECVRRDVKGLYAAGTKAMTGVDDPYEPPTSPDLSIDTTDRSVAESVAAVHGLLVAQGV